MDRREALLLVERLKRRTRDPDVLTLCEYVHGTDIADRGGGTCVVAQIGLLDPGKLPITGAAFSSPVGINP
jgi:hypothetical protein